MKRNYIQLVKNVKDDGTPELETFFTPAFIPLRKVYEAVDLLAAEENEEQSEQQQILSSLNYIAEVYGNQFTAEELLDKLHAPDAMTEIQSQIEFIAQGKMEDDRKKKLAQMLS